jgi:type I restriction enzyme S subunit
MSFDLKTDSSDISLKDAVEFIVDNRGKTAPTASQGIALIATNCVNNNDLYPQKLNLRYVSQETYETWFRSHPKPGDILLTNKGSQNGAICLVPDPVDFCIAQDMVALRADPKKISPKYLFAALRSDIVQKRIKALNVDAVIPHLKKTDFNKLFIPMPSRSMQDWIGDCYFELSSRIELLRETNTTLEAIAQALFKSWFVDFDPVHAKQQGRIPEGMDEVTAALFPDSFEESELGLVPKGWRIGTLGDELRIAYGKNLPTTKLLEAGFPVYGGNGRIGYFDSYLYEQRQVLVSCRGAASGKVSQSVSKAFVTNNSLVLESTQALSFCYLKGFMTRADLTPYVTGSAQPQVTIDNLKNFKIVIPEQSLVAHYENIVSIIEDRIDANNQQAQTLATLRDTLLPRLISGQLRLNDIESKHELVSQ